MTSPRRNDPVSPRFILLAALVFLLTATPLRFRSTVDSTTPTLPVCTTADAALAEESHELGGDPDMPEAPAPVQPGRTGGTRRSTWIEVRDPRTPPPTFILLEFLARWPVYTLR